MAQSGFERALSWGLLASPLALSLITALSKTPAGSHPHGQGLFYLSWLAGCVVACAGGLACARWRGARFKRVAAVGLSALFEVAWVVLYLMPAGKTPVGIAACTLLTAASIAGLAQLWLVTGRQPTVRGELLRASVALLGGYALYTFMTVLEQPLVASFAYPVATGALVVVGVAWEEDGGEQAPAVLPLARPNVGALVFSLLFCVVLGASVSLVCRNVPQEGTYNGLGLALIALAVPAVVGTRLPALTPALFVGPFAVAALCFELLGVSGTSAACLLAALVVLAVWSSLRCEAADGGALAPVWPRAAATLLLFEALGLLCGFLLDRLVLDGICGMAWDVRLVTAVILAAATDACWRAVPTCPALYGAGWSVTARGTVPSGSADLVAARYHLSPREVQVAELLGENRSLNYICKVLELAPSTVKTHVGHIYEKTGAHGKDELQLLMRDLEVEQAERAGEPRG